MQLQSSLTTLFPVQGAFDMPLQEAADDLGITEPELMQARW